MKMLGVILGAVLLSCSVIAAADQQTLVERVRAEQEVSEIIVRREFSPAVELRELAEDADLIARVLILDSGRGRLSGNERSIDSEYVVQVLDELFSRQTLQPGVTVVVRKPGGTMNIEDREVKAFERDFPPFLAGEEYVLFLKLDVRSGTYVVPYGAQGAFRNVGGIVEQVSRQGIWNYERDGDPVRTPISSFTQELVGVINAR